MSFCYKLLKIMYKNIMAILTLFTIAMMLVAMALHATDLMIAMGVMAVICRINANDKE